MDEAFRFNRRAIGISPKEAVLGEAVPLKDWLLESLR